MPIRSPFLEEKNEIDQILASNDIESFSEFKNDFEIDSVAHWTNCG